MHAQDRSPSLPSKRGREGERGRDAQGRLGRRLHHGELVVGRAVDSSRHGTNKEDLHVVVRLAEAHGVHERERLARDEEVERVQLDVCEPAVQEKCQSLIV